MTVVGDVGQTGSLAGTSSWAHVLTPYVEDRWRMTELTVCYRTPAEIMELAGRLLAGIDTTLSPPRAVRATGVPPWRERAADAAMAPRLVAAVRAECDHLDAGRLGVVVPDAMLDALGGAVATAVPGTSVGDRSDVDTRIVVLTVAQARGLEFDSVIVVDPAAILAASPRGRSDLYVALTRATKRLGILHPGALPAELDDGKR